MTTEEPSWQPVVTDPGRVAAIRDILGEIVAAVEAAPIEEHGLDPLIDRAVLRAYLAQDGAVPDPDDAAGEHLSRAIGRFGEIIVGSRDKSVYLLR